MLKIILENRKIFLTQELSNAVIQDIKFNNIGFNRKTNLKNFLNIAEICNKTLKRCN
ncbi:hypothetical protein 10S11_67 [uncultured Caudovirales phage]|uniref:Uncharacterized protein n=1 Tax=uncultured Caudovirales phage TaxID=2100421 RepID=A0A2H4J1R9_9CAUD|nr:hypothetical protein 10S11_67 [uncultured Caudovirales phage]